MVTGLLEHRKELLRQIEQAEEITFAHAVKAARAIDHWIELCVRASKFFTSENRKDAYIVTIGGDGLHMTREDIEFFSNVFFLDHTDKLLNFIGYRLKPRRGDFSFTVRIHLYYDDHDSLYVAIVPMDQAERFRPESWADHPSV